MTPETHYQVLGALIKQLGKRFLREVKAYEGRLNKELQLLTKELTVSATGNVKPTQANIRVVSRIQKVFVKTFGNDAYEKKVVALLEGFDELALLQNKYLRILDQRFNEGKTVYQFVLSSSKELTYNSLTNAGLDMHLLNPVKDILNRNVTTGAKYQDLVEELTSQIVGNASTLGKYERYAKQITTDALNQFSRNYLETAASDLKLEWYYYAGTTRATTRDFCNQRVGKYYHLDEIKGWAASNWKGKIPATNASNIFIYLGGFQCNHQLIPVAASSVPVGILEEK